MDAQQQRTIAVLNRLYAAERHSLLPRLAEAAAFVSVASATEAVAIHRMISEENEHIEWLVEAIEQADGVVYPAGPDINTGHLHFLEIHALLPLVIKSIETLVRVYHDAAAQSISAPAAEVVNRIAQRHQSHLDQLHKFETRSPVAK